MKTLLSILLVATISINISNAQEDFKIPVKMRISGETGIEGQVRSYFNREFRAIGDVEVVDENGGKDALLGISIVVMEPNNKSGVSMGYIISIAVTDRSPVVFLAMGGLSLTSDEAKRKQLSQLVPKDGILVNHLIQTLDNTQLPETCRALAAQLDGSDIENIRKQRRDWQTLMNKQK